MDMANIFVAGIRNMVRILVQAYSRWNGRKRVEGYFEATERWTWAQDILHLSHVMHKEKNLCLDEETNKELKPKNWHRLV